MTRRQKIASLAVAGVLAFAACSDSADTTTTTLVPDESTTTSVDGTTSAPTTAPDDGSTTTTRRTTTSEDDGSTTTTRGGSTTTTTTRATATTQAGISGDALAAALAVREAPLTVELDDGTTVTFSEWFFATFNREATVTVERNGTVLAEGTVTDESVMEDRGTEGFAIFGPGGDIVARISQDQLLDAANQALVDAGLAP